MYKSILFSILAVSLISCAAFDPCQNKDLFIKKHKSFVEESIKNVDNYSDNDWEDRDEEFDSLMNDCYSNVEGDMTKEQKKQFWLTNSKYLSLRVKDNSLEGVEALTGLIESLSGDGADIAAGLQEAFGDDLKETLGDFEDDLKDVFDEDFKRKLEDVFDEDFKNDLKKTFEDLGDKLKEMGEELKEVVEEEN